MSENVQRLFRQHGFVSTAVCQAGTLLRSGATFEAPLCLPLRFSQLRKPRVLLWIVHLVEVARSVAFLRALLTLRLFHFTHSGRLKLLVHPRHNHLVVEVTQDRLA